MTEYVRVEADNGAHVTLPKGYAETRGLKILDEPALDRYGRPLPEAPSSAGDKPAKKKAAPHKRRAAKKATAPVAEAAAPAADVTPSGSDTAASTTEEK
jgi:hypothetical protein